MSVPEPVPDECRGLDIPKLVGRLPGEVGQLLLSAGARRMNELDRAIAASSPPAVMEAAHSLANVVGVLPIPSLAVYTREIYAAAVRGDLDSIAQAHQRLGAVMGWVLRRLGGEDRPAG